MDDCTYTFEPTASLNYGQIFFMTIGMIPFFICLPTWIIAKFVWEPMEKERLKNRELFKQRIKEFKRRELPYSQKYALKDDGEDSKEPNITNIILERTPEGYVAMRYNKDETGFEYWSDKSIPYNHLETVARRYVNAFHCFDIYINRRKHLQEKIVRLTKEIKDNLEGKKKLEDEKGSDDEDEVEEEESVFAKLRKYNERIKDKIEEKEKLTRHDYVCDKANKYIQKGKFKDNKTWLSSKPVETSEGGVLNWIKWKQTQKTD